MRQDVNPSTLLEGEECSGWERGRTGQVRVNIGQESSAILFRLAF